jgi:hypothetical protein
VVALVVGVVMVVLPLLPSRGPSRVHAVR